MSQSFLFLQGPGSPLFPLLGKELIRQGHKVLKVNFCGGDRLFGLGLPSVSFRRKPSQASTFFESIIAANKVTDVVLFGDCRSIHQTAMGVAKSAGARIWVIEEGYLRPDWITLERDGVNGFSSLPKTPEEYFALADSIPEREDRKMPGGFKRRVLFDILYYVANGLLYPLYLNYETHRLYPMPFEYAGWIRRLALRIMRREERRAERTTQSLIASMTPFYLFPLQLDTDFQIRTHSDFGRLNPVIELVIASFAAHAPRENVLVIKNHPLDNGMVDLRRFIAGLAKRNGVHERVHFIDGGHLPTLLSVTRGVVVVNSTVGFSALIHGRPLKALGKAFYDMPGLTFQGNLDDFWAYQAKPDRNLLNSVRKVVLHTTQINGNLFTVGGLAAAVPQMANKLTNVSED
jgi:capsular polysaccharide export protein